MMLKEKKIDFQRGCEEYIEEQGLYEIFEDMMKSLIVNKPEDPVKYLIDKLEKPESKSNLFFKTCTTAILWTIFVCARHLYSKRQKFLTAVSI